MLSFLLLPYHTLFTKYHMLQHINRSRQMWSCLKKSCIKHQFLIHTPLCFFLRLLAKAKTSLILLGLIIHCFLSIYRSKSKWRQIRDDFGAHHPLSLCVQRETSLHHLLFPCIFFPFHFWVEQEKHHSAEE